MSTIGNIVFTLKGKMTINADQDQDGFALQNYDVSIKTASNTSLIATMAFREHIKRDEEGRIYTASNFDASDPAGIIFHEDQTGLDLDGAKLSLIVAMKAKRLIPQGVEW